MLHKITNDHEDFLSKSSSVSSLANEQPIFLNIYKILGIPEPVKQSQPTIKNDNFGVKTGDLLANLNNRSGFFRTELPSLISEQTNEEDDSNLTSSLVSSKTKQATLLKPISRD